MTGALPHAKSGVVRVLTLATSLLAVLHSLACAGSSRSDRGPIGRTLDSERTDAEARASAGAPLGEAPHAEEVPEDVVARAAAELTGVRTSDRTSLGFEATMTHLASADAICIGERHDDAGDHYAELRAIQALLERRSVRGFELGIGLEMVRQPDGPFLQSYIDGGMSDAALEESLQFQVEWGFAFAYYQPIFREARVRFGSLLALGVPREITRDVAEKGLAGINPNQRRALPELDLDVPEHRAVFDSMMTMHPRVSAPGVLDRYYEAQVVWDESMAERAAAWLSQRYPGRKLVILAGAAHCHPSAIPARIKRRAAFTVVSVLPRAKDEPPDAARDQLVRSYEYLLMRDHSPRRPSAARD